MFEYSNTDYVLIKCGNFIDYKFLDILEMKKEEISEVNIYQKGRGSFSSIPLAVAITANARISISYFKNIPGNPLIYSDTDSAVLPLPLPDEFIGDSIGLMSLVNNIKEGFFIGAKLYCYVNVKNEAVIASAGIDPKLLKLDEFKKLYNGEDISKVVERFLVRPSEGRVDIDYKHKFTIMGVKRDSIIQKEIKDTPKWLKNNSLYTIGLDKKIKDKHPFSSILSNQMQKIKNITVNKANNTVNSKRSFHSNPNNNNSKLSIIMDNSNSDLINSRFNDIYKIYDNIF